MSDLDLIAALAAVVLAFLLVPTRSVAAQWPAEVTGRVVDARSGAPIRGAVISSAGADIRVETNASGAFELAGLEEGLHRIRVERRGYAPWTGEVGVAPGRVATLQVTLEPVPYVLDGLEVRSTAAAGGFRIVPTRADAGRSIGDLLVRAPGVVVTSRGPGGAETVSIRGSSADEVLVLVDGVPLNDPLTGEADLSLVPAPSVEEIVVLAGARSARFGPRAQAGVVAIETLGADTPSEATVRAGSLGTIATSIGAGSAGERGGWGLSANLEKVGGSFPFRRPEAVGGGEAARDNADSRRWGAAVSYDGVVARGALSLRARGDRSARGLPGQSFAPSRTARQGDHRFSISLSWDRPVSGSSLQAALFATHRGSRFRDSTPPLGLPYDDSSEVTDIGSDWRLESLPLAGIADVGGGASLRVQRVRAESLEEDAPTTRVDVGLHLVAGRDLRVGALPLRVEIAGRLDRAGTSPRIVASHEVVASAVPVGGVSVRLAHRSAFTPPALADQFFRAGIGVTPNPDLRGERVPSELEAGASFSHRVGRFHLASSASWYLANVRDMIVWQPDFRFVWSPTNVDVRRRGGEVESSLSTALGGGVTTVRVGWALSRVTRRFGEGSAQVRYRPRRTAHWDLDWSNGRTRFGLAGRYLGTRYPVPSPVNALPGFWTVGVTVSTVADVVGWRIEPTLSVDRLLDQTESMIFGFPEPGRTLTAAVTVSPPA